MHRLARLATREAGSPTKTSLEDSGDLEADFPTNNLANLTITNDNDTSLHSDPAKSSATCKNDASTQLAVKCTTHHFHLRTPCKSRISNHSTPRITVEQIEEAVESFIENFRLELEESEAEEIEKQNIKEQLQETLVKYEQTQEELVFQDGFFGKCYNRFLDFINVKCEDNTTLFQTVIQAPEKSPRSNLTRRFDIPEEDEEVENYNMAVRRGPSCKDIVQLVPSHSGSDKDEAIKFVKGCRLAEELLEENQKADFLKFIKDNVRRETSYNDEQYRTQNNVHRETTYEPSEQIATYKEHTLTRDEEYHVSAELNDGQAKPSQQIDEREENSHPSAGASRRGVELLCEQIRECNTDFRANREVLYDKMGRGNKRMPESTEEIVKSDNSKFAVKEDEATDKGERPSTNETECIERKECQKEEMIPEDISSHTDTAIHCIEGNILDNDVRCDETFRAEEDATYEHSHGKPRLPSDEEWDKYYEIFGQSLNIYEADYDDVNDICEYTDNYEKIETGQSECEFIGHLDEYGDEHLEDFSGESNIVYDNERLDQLLEILKIYETSDQRIVELIKEFQDVFHTKGKNLTTMHNVEYAYRFPQSLKEELERQLNEMIILGIIEPSCSSYRSNIFLVPKAPDNKGNKKYQLVVDFRQLNEKTEPDRYPLPNILDIIDHVGNATYFSTLDLSSGFYQCMLKEEHSHKTAFSTEFGLFQFVKMPMGLSNSPATFQMGMDIAFKGQQQKDIFLYLNDAVIFLNTKEEHYVKLHNFLARAREVNLKLQPEKCNFLKTEVVYLGHVLTRRAFHLRVTDLYQTCLGVFLYIIMKPPMVTLFQWALETIIKHHKVYNII
uniref:Reverse transcriptase domain-containing protein n=1 Tax=Trichogramma kaykai TaxID=54128 RepID=A0ABD2XHB3_9HYME